MNTSAVGSGKGRRGAARKKTAAGGTPEPRQLGEGFGWLRGRMAWLAALVMVFGAITLWRFDIVDSPPYWDSAMGLFLEADFLARSGFNYQALFGEERRFIEGGSGIYLVSVLPTLLAGAMACLPSVKAVLIVGHLATFLAATVLVLLVFAILRRRIAWDEAALVCAALLTTPLMAAQVDMIGMDLPMAVGATLAFLFLLGERYALATAAAFFAFFIKISGGIATAGIIVYLAMLVGLGGAADFVSSRRRRWIGLGTGLLVLAIELLVINWSMGLPQSQVEQYETDVQQGISSLAEARFWCPDLVVLLALAAGLDVLTTISQLFANWRKSAGEGLGNRARQLATEWLRSDRHQFFAWVLIVGTLAVLSRIYTIPRYLTLPLVFLWFHLAALLFDRLRWRRGGMVFVGLVIAFNLLNSYGRFYPAPTSVDRFDGRTGAFLERSREYLADHRANLEAVRTLKQVAPGRKIVAPNPFVHFLALPGLGYVEAPLDGYAVNTFTTPTFPPVGRLRDAPPEDLIFVWVESRFTPLAQCVLPPPTAGDRVLYESGSPASLAVFQKRYPGRPTLEAQKAQYLSLLWPGEQVFERAKQLMAQGKTGEAIEAFKQVVMREPLRFEAHLRLAELFAATRQYEAALQEYQFLLEQTSWDNSIHRAIANLLIQTGEWDEARKHLARAIELNPQDYDAYLALGILAGRQHRLSEAESSFRSAIRCRPKAAGGYYWLGVTLETQGRRDEAIAMFERTLELAPDYVEAHTALAGILALADPQAAANHYRKALELKPGAPDIANSLAWLLATSAVPEVRNGAEAVRLAEQVCGSHPDRAEYIDTLAAAYAESGQFDQAIKVAETARHLAEQSNQAEFRKRIDEHIRQYRSNQPLREMSSGN